MDYNDNEFQSQNTRLVGEDNSRFPPGIRSFALPKFDLDEHLQVQLRFDSLVEAEILLGIENQEEHHWIEDYSRESSGILVLDPVSQSIEAESCSISRRNNVWSEATSSESVEMLLNSVGQDDMIIKQSVSKEYDDCDAPMDCINGQMDPKSSQDNPVSSNIGDTPDVDPMQLPANCLKSSSGLIEDAGGNLCHVEEMPETHEVDKTVYESFVDGDQSSVDEKCGIFDKFISSHSSLEGNVDSFQDESAEHLLISGNYNEELEVPAMGPEMQKDNLVMEASLGDRFLEKDASNSHCSAARGGEVMEVSLGDRFLEKDAANSHSLGDRFLEKDASNSHCSAARGGEVMEVSLGDRFLEKDAANSHCFSARGEVMEVSLGDRFLEKDAANRHCSAAREGEVMEVCLGDRFLEKDVANSHCSDARGEVREVSLGDRFLEKDAANSHCSAASGGEVMEVSLADRFLEKDAANRHCSAARGGEVMEVSLGDGFLEKDVVNSHCSAARGEVMEVSLGDRFLEKDVANSHCSVARGGEVMEVSLGDRFLEKDAANSHCSAARGGDFESIQVDDSSVTLLAIEVPLGDRFLEKDAVNSTCSAASGGGIESMQVDDSSGTPLQNVEQITEGSTEFLCKEKPGGLLEDDNHLMESEISVTDTVMTDQYIKCQEEKPSTELEGNQAFQSHSDETHYDTTMNPSGLVTKMDAPLDITHGTKDDLHIKDSCSNLETNAEDSNDRDMESVVSQNKMQEKMENDIGGPDVIVNDSNNIVPEPGPTLPDLPNGDVTDVCNKEFSETGDRNSSDLVSAMETTVIVQEVPKNGNYLVVTEKLVLDAQNSQNTEPDGSILKVMSGSVVGEVSGDITNSTSFNNREFVHSVLPEDKLVSDDAIEQKEVDAPHSPVTLSDKKEELVNGDSMEPCMSALQESIDCDAGSGVHLETFQCTDHSSAVELFPETVTCSSGSAEKSELETVDHDSGNGDHVFSNVPKVSSENYGATSFHASGDPPNPDERTSSGPDNFSRNNSESLPMVPGIDATVEADCGSPTIISCTKNSQSIIEHQEGEGNKKSSGQNDPVSEDLPRDSSHVYEKVEESVSHGTGNDDPSENDKSFTFEVGSLVAEETNVIANSSSLLATETNGKGWKPFHDIQPIKLPQSGESSPMPPGSYQTNGKVLEETPQGNNDNKDLSTDKCDSQGGSANKGAVEEGKVANEMSCSEHKGTTLHEDGSSCRSLASSSETLLNRAVQVEEKQQCPVTPVQTSSLPDLNTSASPASVLFQQPFTDLQQIQLRAQIFVYGSLIQGTVPDEACMISAFGETGRDGGRNVWENVWRIASERLHNQKSPLNNPETPVHSRSGLRIPEQPSRGTPLQNKTTSTPAGRTGMKGSPPAILNTSISLPSPVWSMPTPSREGVLAGAMGRGPLLDSHQTVGPLHLYQSPHIRHYVGPNNPWPSQQPCNVPWFFTPQTSAFDAGPHYSTLPTSETVQVTPVRDHPGVPSIPRSPGVQPGPSSPLPATVGSITVPASASIPVEGKRKPATTGRKASAEQKPRKRKKSSVSEEVGPSDSILHANTEPPPAINANKPAPMTLFTPNPAPKVTGYATNSAITAPTHYQIISGGNSEQRVTLSEETCSRIEQAKLQAEDAAALAASAVRHSQGIWTQLDNQKNSGLLSEVEARLASAAVAAAAAASVAKAAAAAAKVACDAALQAKLMADEALNFTKIGNTSRGSETGPLEGRKNLGKVTLASILKGRDTTDSVIAVAREAARKRVEAASAAAKQAENLDAVVRAAELAAEAVSQAGALIVMGDPVPLTLSELVESGPEGLWKVHQTSNNQMRELLNVEVASGGLDGSSKHVNERFPSRKDIKRSTEDGKTSSAKELSKQSVESQKEFLNGMYRDSVKADKGLGVQKGRKSSDLARTVGVVPESETGTKGASFSVQNDEDDRPVGPTNENIIKEGSLVEVVSDEEGLRRVWFSAKVLSLKDGKAYVCYSELLSDEGRGQLKEWIPLEGDGDNAPRIRNAHPMTAIKFEGTRKRRRAAMGNYVWSVGDHVDAWMRDGWWEGIVAEKHKDDENKFTVNFPAEGDSFIVKTWNLRPSLIWKNGQWIEWSKSGESNPGYHEGDTPQDKRQKLGNLELESQVDARGREKLPKDLFENSKKLENSKSLALSAKEKMFTAGKNFKDENNSAALRVQRTGLQKEGSKVVFGVPKPGKKKKFMDVSKHYVTDKVGKINEGNDSIKFTQYLMPQSSRGLRNVPKVDFKGKQVTDSKSKVLKSGKSQSIQSKGRSEKDSSSISLLPAPVEATRRDPLMSTKDSVGHEENKFEKQNMLEVGYFSNPVKPAEGPVLFSSLELMPDAHPSRKKSSSVVDSEQGTKGHLVAADEKLISDEKASITIDIPVRPISDASEPRRSNRRIQPTSRLLEGLQSSPVIPKAPVSTHDKASRTQNRNASSLKGNNHG